MANENNTQAQRIRLLDYLRTQSIDTLTARRELDILMPATCIFELRKQGYDIRTIWVDRVTDCGKTHRVACYVLRAGAAATAPAKNTDGITASPRITWEG